MDGNPVGVALGLVAAAGWGVADFGGGYISPGRDSLGIVLGSQLAGLVMVVAAGIVLSQPAPSLREAGAEVAGARPARSTVS